MFGFYSFFFVHEGNNVTVTFQANDGLTLDCIESLAKCSSLYRRQWAATLIDSIEPGDTVVNLTEQRLFGQTPFRTIIENEFGSEGLVSYAHNNSNITLRITRMVILFY